MFPNHGGTTVHKDEVKGSGKKLRGEVKDKVGKATGDDKMRADGKADKAEGSIQKGVGKAKDAARDALKH
nr:CsbD family protein [Devosia nitrariae]